MRERRRRTRAGFTLLECLIAIALLAIGIMGALSAIPISARATTEATQESTAAEHLATAAELVQGTPYASLAATFPDGGTFSASQLALVSANLLPGEQIAIKYRKWDASGAQQDLTAVTVPPTQMALPPVGSLDKCSIELTIDWFRDSPKTLATNLPLIYTASVVRSQ
jgi:prepilin-type N-terminal cleavage/methylation domain-containing protein